MTDGTPANPNTIDGKGNTTIVVKGAGAKGIRLHSESRAEFERLIVQANNATAALSFENSGSANTVIKMGANSSLVNPGGDVALIYSVNPEPLQAGDNLAAEGNRIFVYQQPASIGTVTTTLKNATVTADTHVWEVQEDGRVQFTADDGTYEGTSAAAAGSQLDVTLTNNALWHMTGDSALHVLTLDSGGTLAVPNGSYKLTGEVNTSSGLVDLSGPAPQQTGDELTVDGTWSGGGILQLDTQLGDDTSPTDKLIIVGDVIGTTQIKINNLDGLGDETTGDGILVVQVQGNDSPADGFALDGTTVQGGDYAYSLVQVGKNWYLQSTFSPPPPLGPGSVQPVPTLGWLGLALLSSLLAGFGLRRHQQS